MLMTIHNLETQLQDKENDILILNYILNNSDPTWASPQRLPSTNGQLPPPPHSNFDLMADLVQDNKAAQLDLMTNLVSDKKDGMSPLVSVKKDLMSHLVSDKKEDSVFNQLDNVNDHMNQVMESVTLPTMDKKPAFVESELIPMGSPPATQVTQVYSAQKTNTSVLNPNLLSSSEE